MQIKERSGYTVQMPEIVFWSNFSSSLQGPHKTVMLLTLCHSCKMIFFRCFQLINMSRFLLLVPNNFIFLSQLFQTYNFLFPKLF